MKPIVIQISGRQLLVAVLGMFATMMVMISVSIVYTNTVDQESNQAWCDIINGLNDRYQKLPPTADPDAKQFASQIQRLKVRYKC